MTEKQKYRVFSREQKLVIVLAGMRGDWQVKDVCREHQISDTLVCQWRDQLLEAAKERFAGSKGAAPETQELRKRVSQAASRWLRPDPSRRLPFRRTQEVSGSHSSSSVAFVTRCAGCV